MGEEWPELLDRLCADPGTVLDLEDPKPLKFCVLSPFRGQLWTLQKLLNEWLADEDNRRAVREKAAARREDFLRILEELGMDAYLSQGSGRKELRRALDGLPDQSEAARVGWTVDRLIETLPDRLRPFLPGEGRRADPMEIQLPELTIHKVQGQEYDIVYFLPVEDKHWEWPWSQKKRLINVAVSRAKKELRIIASAALMDEDIQRELTGGRCARPKGRPSGGADGEKDNAFLRKLIRYVWEKGPRPGLWTDGPFGFHRAPASSLFDQAVYLVRGRERDDPDSGEKFFPSGPEVCFQDWLRALPLAVENRLSVYTDAPISAIVPPPAGIDNEQGNYIKNGAHFDFVVCRGERILLAVEVDGAYHRTEPEGRGNDKKSDGENGKNTIAENDQRKNAIAGTGFRAAAYRAAGGGLQPMEGSAPPAESSFDFLRLPTDGSAWNEGALIEGLLRERLSLESGPVYELPVRSLDGLPDDRRRYVFWKLSRPQNWLTGRPAEREEPRENVRWVPTKDGTREGLMMAYLPGSGDRLYPSLVCQRDAWEQLCREENDDL